jgi:membrane-associated phospholipid phosphatase
MQRIEGTARMSFAPSKNRNGILAGYTFVDYATQGYSALVALLILCFHNRTLPNWPGLLALHAAGLVLVHTLIRAGARWNQNQSLALLRHFYPVLLYGAFFCETGHLNRFFFPDYLDAHVVQLDQAIFGCQPGIILMQKFPWLALSELLYAAYFSYYLMIGGVGIALFVRDRRNFFHYVSVVSFVFYVCYLIYIFLPVVGPQVFSHEVAGYELPESLQRLAPGDAYPVAVKAGVFFKLMAWIYRVFESPGAAFPSSHVAVALCTVFFSFRYLRPIRYIHLTMAVPLCLSTMYCHYHYGADVLAGIVTAVLLIPLGNWLYLRFAERSQGELEPGFQIPRS